MTNRLIRAGPGIGEEGPRRIGRPAATPADHPELHSETALSNDNPGCTPTRTALATSRRFRGLPRNRSLKQPEQCVPRLPGAVSVDPDVATTRRTLEVTSNVSTAHTGMGALGPPDPSRAMGRAG